MANPRKFSEKIALQIQKQAEETAAFESIMREVSDATNKVSRTPNLAPSAGLGTFKAGSLPNVSAPKNNEQKNKNNKKQPEDGSSMQFGVLGNSIAHDVHSFKESLSNKNIISNSTNTVRESRGRSVGVGPMRRPGDRKIDTSPYGGTNTAYLSPPSDTSWRRTSSDSAIHQSVIQNQDHHHCHHNSPSPLTLSPVQRRAHNHSNSSNLKNFSNEQSNHNSIGMSDVRPRSSCGLSRLPGINIYPSQHDNSIQIPIQNTGSLPDLTSVHFPSPLHTPVDEHSSSPYSSSPLTASPSTLSPTAMPTRYQNNVQKFHYSPAHSPGDSNSYSPTQSQHTSQRNNLLYVPGRNNYLHGNKNITNSLENSQSQPQQIRHFDHNQVQFQHSPPNNNVLHGSHGALNNQPSLSGYRSPQCRPSPGSSPGLIQSLSNNGDSNPSAPCSPVPTPLGSNGQSYESYSNEGYIFNQSPIQQQFEQFSLVDHPSTEFITNSSNTTNFPQYENSTFTHLNSINLDDLNSQSNVINNVDSSSLNIAVSNPLNTNNSLHNNMNSRQSQQTHQQNQLQNNPQTPNTPTSIPEIIFTDFSSNGNEFNKDVFQGLRTFDLELGYMDDVGYQMLSDPTLITDSRTEESFREDLDET